MGKIYDKPEMTSRRRELRNNPTPAEEFLWSYLRRSRLEGRKFRRQHSIDCYVVDFYCPEERLVIELDGDVHNSEDAKEYDSNRTKFIKSFDIKIIRFENNEVIYNIDRVLGEIKKHFKSSSALTLLS